MKSTLNSISAKAQKTAKRYLGEDASHYEAKRIGTLKWLGEDRKVKEFLADLPKGTSILDIPCGTGRFFPFYHEKRFIVLGMDISPDMVAEAKKRAGNDILVQVGSIFNIIGACRAFEVVVCIRFLNLIEAADLQHALAEMQHVARSRVIFTLRVRQKNPTGHYHSPHAISLIEESLLPGWKIGRNEPVHQEDYRLIELINEMG